MKPSAEGTVAEKINISGRRFSLNQLWGWFSLVGAMSVCACPCYCVFSIAIEAFITPKQLEFLVFLTNRLYWYFYHGLCLKGKPYSCGHSLGFWLTNHLAEQTRTDMSANTATGPRVKSSMSHDCLITVSSLSHHCLMTISWSWLSHNCLITVSWLSHDFLMTVSWLSHDFLMTPSWQHGTPSWTMGHLPGTMAHLTGNMEHLPSTMGQLPDTI